MATLYTHAFVGLAGARLYADRPMPWAYWGLAAALPMIPDLDVFFTGTYRTASATEASRIRCCSLWRWP